MRPRIVHQTGLIACVALLAACVETEASPASAQPPPQLQSRDLRVAIHGNNVTVHAYDATLRDVVEQIARHIRVVLVSQDPLDERVSLNLKQAPVAEALREILRDRGFVLQQAARQVARTGRSFNPGSPGDARAGRLWIFSKGLGHGRAPPTRTLANSVEEFEEFDADGAIAALSDSLADDDANARLDAVSALAEVGSDEAAAALAVAALHDADSSVREEAVYALGGIGGDTGYQALAGALADSNADVRQAAIGALEELGTDRSVRALADALNDTNVAIRTAALDALGEIGGDTAIRLLQQASTDSHAMVREAAAGRLAELRIRAGPATLSREQHSLRRVVSPAAGASAR